METTQDFLSIVLNNIPLIDVRAPIEFEKGAFPHAVNLPILDNEERRIIGITYKEAGNDTATNLGYHLVSGDNKAHKIEQWNQFIHLNPNALLYCFRGGQRSSISQQWIYEELQHNIPRLEGGYKAFRQYLMDALLSENQQYSGIRLGGHTGSGKTKLLHTIEHHIDLENLANHRGSSFGYHLTPQPTQINFENQLAYAILQSSIKQYTHLIFEDEGKHIGRCFLPTSFYLFLEASPLIVVLVPLEERSYHILTEYVIASQNNYIDQFGDERGPEEWLSYIHHSIFKLKKRLGGANYTKMTQMATDAFYEQQRTHSPESHLSWIHFFLQQYYDPMYAYQLEQNKSSIVFSGNTKEVISLLQSCAFTNISNLI